MEDKYKYRLIIEIIEELPENKSSMLYHAQSHHDTGTDIFRYMKRIMKLLALILSRRTEERIKDIVLNKEKERVESVNQNGQSK